MSCEDKISKIQQQANWVFLFINSPAEPIEHYMVESDLWVVSTCWTLWDRLTDSVGPFLFQLWQCHRGWRLLKCGICLWLDSVRSDALLHPRGRTPVTHTEIAPQSMSLHGAQKHWSRGRQGFSAGKGHITYFVLISAAPIFGLIYLLFHHRT